MCVTETQKLRTGTRIVQKDFQCQIPLVPSHSASLCAMAFLYFLGQFVVVVLVVFSPEDKNQGFA